MVFVFIEIYEKKRKANSQVVSVTVPLEILTAIDEYCAVHYIPRTSFFVKAVKTC